MTAQPTPRDNLARLINDEHQCTRLWEDLRIGDPAWTRSNGDDYAIRTAYDAADAVIAAGWTPPLELIVTSSERPADLLSAPTEEQVTADEARVMAEAYLKGVDVYDRAHEPEEIARQAYVEGYTKAHQLATDQYDRIIALQGDLLRRTVNALRGDPPHLMNWSHHDVVDLAKAAVEALAQQYVLDAGFEWEDMDETTKEHYRTQARAEIQVVEL